MPRPPQTCPPVLSSTSGHFKGLSSAILSCSCVTTFQFPSRWVAEHITKRRNAEQRRVCESVSSSAQSENPVQAPCSPVRVWNRRFCNSQILDSSSPQRNVRACLFFFFCMSCGCSESAPAARLESPLWRRIFFIQISKWGSLLCVFSHRRCLLPSLFTSPRHIVTVAGYRVTGVFIYGLFG